MFELVFWNLVPVHRPYLSSWSVSHALWHYHVHQTIMLFESIKQLNKYNLILLNELKSCHFMPPLPPTTTTSCFFGADMQDVTMAFPLLLFCNMLTIMHISVEALDATHKANIKIHQSTLPRCSALKFGKQVEKECFARLASLIYNR